MDSYDEERSFFGRRGGGGDPLPTLVSIAPPSGDLQLSSMELTVLSSYYYYYLIHVYA